MTAIYKVNDSSLKSESAPVIGLFLLLFNTPTLSAGARQHGFWSGAELADHSAAHHMAEPGDYDDAAIDELMMNGGGHPKRTRVNMLVEFPGHVYHPGGSRPGWQQHHRRSGVVAVASGCKQLTALSTSR